MDGAETTRRFRLLKEILIVFIVTNPLRAARCCWTIKPCKLRLTGLSLRVCVVKNVVDNDGKMALLQFMPFSNLQGEIASALLQFFNNPSRTLPL